MTSNLLFAIGTLAAWVGVGLLLRSVFLALTRRAGTGLAAGIGAVLLLAAASTPAFEGRLEIPLVWLSMPFSGWVAAVGSALTVFWTIQSVLNASLRTVLKGVLSAVVAVAFLCLYRGDPENHFSLLRGRIMLSVLGVLALTAAAIASVATMVGAHRGVRRRSPKLLVHATLLVGCIVFGTPFAWLLVTSFKEDRDMASPNGVVWIPRVQRTVDYVDRADPLLEGLYRGDWIQASVAGRASNGDYIVEVQRPSSLRGVSFVASPRAFKVVPKQAPVVRGRGFSGYVIKELDDGRRLVRFLTPASLAGSERTYLPSELEPVRDIGLRTLNYTEALEAMPPETHHGMVYLRNTLILVILSVIGTLLSCSLVAFGFARLRFPGREFLFKVLLATMMLPGAVTLLPQFLLFRSLGWIDSLLPLWVPAFFGGAFNVFLLRQFFVQIPMELEDAGKIDGASVLGMFWRIMLPQMKPALAVVAIWTFMGAWNNFMGPLIYVNTPDNMPLSYALQLFQSERGGDPGLMMAFTTLTIIPVLALFFFAQRYFIEGVTLSGFGGR